MDMEFSKDIESYKKQGFKGIRYKSLLYGILTAAIGSVIIYAGNILLHLHILICVYIAIPFMLPLVFLGFQKRNQYTMAEVMQRRKEIQGYCRHLPYVSTEKELFKEKVEEAEEGVAQ